MRDSTWQAVATNLRHLVGIIAGSVVVIEFASALVVLLRGPFAVHVGPVPVSGGSATKLLAIGIVAASAASWLMEPFQSAGMRARVESFGAAVVAVAVVASAASLVGPFFPPEFLIGHDGGVHQTYAFLFDRALRQGQFPVRWVEGITYGTGQPLFNYYQVGFYYLTSLLHAWGISLTHAIKLVIALAWLGGAGLTFLWLKPHGRLPALFGASLFAWSPYVMVDGYVRTAYPELLAIGVAPGVFWSIDRLIRTARPIYVCTLALTTALVLLAHLPASLILAPVCAAYTVTTLAVRRLPASRLALVGSGAAIGVSLAAFYVFPSIQELGAIKIRALTTSYFDYHLHFVRPKDWIDWSWGYAASGTGAPDHVSFQIGILQWTVIAAASAVMVVAAIQRVPAALSAGGWLAIIAAALFMMTSASAGVWNRFPPLAFVQFPWRILMVPTIACSALAATLLSLVERRFTQALILVSAVALQWSVTRDYRAPAWTRTRVAIAIDKPAWPVSANARTWAFREPGYDPLSVTGPASPVAARWTVTQGRGDVEVLAATDARLTLRVEAKQLLTLVVTSPFFPGWRLAVDNAVVAPQVQPQSGFMAVQVPAGWHRVDATFRNTPIRNASEAVSGAGMVVWVAIFGWSLKRSR